MVVTDGISLTARLRQEALALGFSHVGFAPAVALEEESVRLNAWLNAGYHAGMQWIAKDPARRSDPRLVLEGAESVMSVAMNYFTPGEHSRRSGDARISRYAWGDDYHELLGSRLAALEGIIMAEIPGARTRRYVDTGPVMDKAWAVRSGIGWLGKHGNVITRDMGSWIFLGEILTTAKLDYDAPMEDYCGSCTRCLEECPTQAIVRPYVVDSARCLSYLTIEHRGEFPEEVAALDFSGWAYGCDTCQDVCPWNSFAQPSAETGFEPRAWNVAPRIESLAEMTAEEFRERYRQSPVKRTKVEGMRRNARTLLRQHESHTDTETESTEHRKDYGTS